MAERRMFSKVIVQSARFLKMPLTSQALYFQLGVSADDDGIVEAFPVMRMAGAAEDDLRVLVTKNFVQVLNEDLVAYITDWSKNNSIRADRYKKSVYHNLILKMLPDGNQAPTTCQPTGNQAATNGRPSIDKVSIGQESIGQRNSEKKEVNTEEEKEIQGGGQGKYTTAGAPVPRQEADKKNFSQNFEEDALDRQMDTIMYFRERYKQHTGKVHPTEKPEDSFRIAKALDEYDADKSFVDVYFGDESHKGLCGDSDCKIYHFASPGVLELCKARVTGSGSANPVQNPKTIPTYMQEFD